MIAQLDRRLTTMELAKLKAWKYALRGAAGAA